MKIIVYYVVYGCDTGCCGHWIEFEDGEGHIKDLDRENCEIADHNCGF